MQKKSGKIVEFLKKRPNLHQLLHTFQPQQFVFHLRGNFNGSIIFFCTTIFNLKHFLSIEQVRDLQQRLSARYCTSFEYNSRGSAKVLLQKKITRILIALERLALKSLSLLIKITSVTNGSIKVGTLYNYSLQNFTRH